MLIWLVLTIVLVRSGWFKNEAMYGLIHADAQGYYGYLVAGILEGTFDWEQVLASYADYHGGAPADFTRETEFGRINKYYVGTAILVLPFFLFGCLHSLIAGMPVDGYSEPFHLWAMIGALVYVALGTMLLARFLERKGFPTWIAQFVSLTSLFATGLFHYSVSEPVMSHAYSFFLFCGFLFSVQSYSIGQKGKWLIISAAVFALVALVRPSNGLILLAIPFAVGSMGVLKGALSRLNWKYMFVAAVVAVVVLAVQLWMYWLQVGIPVVWSYEGETFDFSNPEILNVLFSYRKGLFVYTPWAALGAIGLFVGLFKRAFESASALVFLVVSVYVISSWWNWYYGSSLGMRAMIEYMPFFAFGLAVLIQTLSKWAAAVVVLLTLATIPINLVQNYQYQKFILHWDGMNKERFWQVFLRTDRKYDGIFYRQERVLEIPAEENVSGRKVFATDFEELGSWGAQGINTEKAFSREQSSLISDHAPYGSTLGVPVTEMGKAGPKKLLITAQVWSEEVFPGLTIAYSFRAADGDYGHEYIGLGQYITEPNEWTEIKHIVDLGEPRDTADNWIVYPFMSGKGKAYVDDLRLEVITLKETVNPTSEQP